MKEFNPRWEFYKYDEVDGTKYFKDPETGKVYWESSKGGWIEA
jgi:hypothetical protein